MGFLIGTDEAGYGPNLGPLIISLSVWQVPDDQLQHDLYRRLRRCIVAKRLPQRPLAQIVMADSKQLYSPGRDLAGLERGVLPALAVTGVAIRSWRCLWQQLTDDAGPQMAELPWYSDFDCQVPWDTEQSELEELAAKLQQGLQACETRLVQVRSQAIFPRRFNQLLQQHGTKGALLSNATLDLVVDAVRSLPPEPVRVVCDKHGGRNHYASLLQPRFEDPLVRVRHESRTESSYQLGPPSRPVDISFQVRGERFLPSALASMTSKYLREAAMRAFNAFWQRHTENLRPTAGYPVDARRFKQEIVEAQTRLGIDDHSLWRQR